MGSYLKHFAIPFVIVGIITVVCLGIYASNNETYVRDNSQTDLTSNVFNYAGNLTDDQVAVLDAYIAEMEEKIGCDIAYVTLNETLEEYVKPYENTIGKQPTSKWVMVYADNFADEHAMGYDAPHGNSIVIVDNIFREPSSNGVHSWISASGMAEDKLSQAECEAILDDAFYGLTDDASAEDFYYAYRRSIELIPGYMSSVGGAGSIFQTKYVVIVALAVAVIYILANLKSKAGKKTTSGNTYVAGGKPNMRVVTDQFTHKTVSKRPINTSSGGKGGSGSHVSSGGFSHGGGGHTR